VFKVVEMFEVPRKYLLALLVGANVWIFDGTFAAFVGGIVMLNELLL
jgi:hypothetical protein